jgi:AcrR family transcriptional regulator
MAEAKRVRVSNAATRSRSTAGRHGREVQRSPKGERTRQQLIKAAAKIFERDGFLNARIVDIVKKAGVSYGSFYHYFDTKEELFRVVAEDVEVTLLSVTPADAARRRDPIERIRTANHDYLAAYVRSAKIMRVISEVSHYDEEVRRVKDRRDDEFNDRLQRSIRRLQEEGLADPAVEPSYAAFALGCMVERFAETFARRRLFDFDTAVEQLTLLWSGAIGLRSPAEHKPRRPTPLRAGST